MIVFITYTYKPICAMVDMDIDICKIVAYTTIYLFFLDQNSIKYAIRGFYWMNTYRIL